MWFLQIISVPAVTIMGLAVFGWGLIGGLPPATAFTLCLSGITIVALAVSLVILGVSHDNLQDRVSRLEKVTQQ